MARTPVPPPCQPAVLGMPTADDCPVPGVRHDARPARDPQSSLPIKTVGSVKPPGRK